MAAAEIYLTQEGEQTGPFSLEDLQGMLSQGQCTMENPAWINGWDDWGTLADVPGLNIPLAKKPIGKRIKRRQPVRSAQNVVAQQSSSVPNYTPVSVGNWMLTFLLVCIPLVGLVMLFVWAFGSNTPVSKANWAKAALIWTLIATILYIIIFVLIFGLIFAAGAAAAGADY